jgi:AhpD family alkylhydroperoxidase
MKSLLKTAAIYIALGGAIWGLIALVSPARGEIVSHAVGDTFKQTIEIIVAVFIFIGLLQVWVPPKTIAKFLGKESGWKGLILASTVPIGIGGSLFTILPLVQTPGREGRPDCGGRGIHHRMGWKASPPSFGDPFSRLEIRPGPAGTPRPFRSHNWTEPGKGDGKEGETMKESVIQRHKPGLWQVYTKFAEEAMKDGALPAKFKELLAIALSIANHCEPCLRVHLRRALELGATAEEVAEVLGVTVLLMGGPADVWTRQALWDELERAKPR